MRGAEKGIADAPYCISLHGVIEIVVSAAFGKKEMGEEERPGKREGDTIPIVTCQSVERRTKHDVTATRWVSIYCM